MLNIIFVDDLPVATERAQAAFRAICDRYGITCAITVKDTAEGFLACVTKQDYDIYVIDIELPDTRGDKLVHAVRAINPMATIAFLSFYNTYGNIAVGARIDAYLYKMYESREMQEQAAILIKKCAAKRQHYRFQTVSGAVDVAVVDILYLVSHHRQIYLHMRDGTIYSVYNTSLTALKAEPQFWQFARLNRNYLVNAKNAVEFDRKRNVIWMQDGQKIKGKKDAIIDMLMLVVAERWHDYGEISEEDVETLQK